MIYRRDKSKTSHYTVIPNATLRDADIKPESLGVLTYLLSHVDEWQVTNKALSNHFNISTGRVSKITEDLASHGYIWRDNVMDSKGKIIRWDWIVCDEPHLENPDLAKPTSGEIKQRSNIEQENHLTRTRTWRDELQEAKPATVGQAAWGKWWEYKSPKRMPSRRILANALLRFEILIDAGHTDFDKIIDITVASGWQSVPQPEWTQIKQIKQSSEQTSILALVR